MSSGKVCSTETWLLPYLFLRDFMNYGGNSCQLLSRFCTIYSSKWKSVHTFWKDILFINLCFSEGKVVLKICIIQGEQVCIRSFFVLFLSGSAAREKSFIISLVHHRCESSQSSSKNIVLLTCVFTYLGKNTQTQRKPQMRWQSQQLNHLSTPSVSVCFKALFKE